MKKQKKKRLKGFPSCAVIVLILAFSTSWAMALTPQPAYASVASSESRTYKNITVSELPASIKTDDGRTLFLDKSKVSQTKTVRKPATAVRTWEDCRYEPEIPETVRIPVTDGDGNSAEVTGYLEKVEIKEIGKTSSFTIPAVFEGDSDCRYFLINGKYVPAAQLADAPSFENYQQELLAYLQLDPAVYTITGAKWEGDFTTDETTGKTIRRAEFSATAANLCDYEAYYRETDFSPSSPLYALTEITARYVPAASAAKEAGSGSGDVRANNSVDVSSEQDADVLAAGVNNNGDGGSNGGRGGNGGGDSASSINSNSGESDHRAAAGKAAADNALAGETPGERDLSAGGGVFGPAGNIDAQTAAALALLAAAVVLFIFSRRRPLHAGRRGKIK